MISTENINKRITDRPTAPARRVAWVFAIGLIPFLFLSMLLVLMSPLYSLPVFLPGYILYINYWQIALDKLTRARASFVMQAAMIYNAFFMAGILIYTEGEAWPLGLLNLALMGFAYIAKRDMREADIFEG